MRLSLVSVSLLVSLIAAVANAGACEDWFAKTGLKAGLGCEIGCAVAATDARTSACPKQCLDLCKPPGDLCRSPQPRQCVFYRSCIERRFQCGAEGYPLRYGEKYCERFGSLSRRDLTEKGLKWRDNTMLCLQRALSDVLYSSSPVRTCSDLQAFAFESHAGCYTQRGSSICDLSKSEMAVIGATVDVGDIMTTAGMSQIVQVLKTCVGYVEAQILRLRGEDQASAWLLHQARFDQLDEEQTQDRLTELEEKLRYLNDL